MACTTQEPAIWQTIVCWGRATSRETPAARIRSDVDPVIALFRVGSSRARFGFALTVAALCLPGVAVGAVVGGGMSVFQALMLPGGPTGE
jgi:hypothetical protein